MERPVAKPQHPEQRVVGFCEVCTNNVLWTPGVRYYCSCFHPGLGRFAWDQHWTRWELGIDPASDPDESVVAPDGTC